MAALAMAILFRGLGPRELSRWTQAMIASGERLDFRLSRPPRTSRDRGVGDKITLPMAPWSRLRCRCPPAVGRGLGHTGAPWNSSRRSPAGGADLSTAECSAAEQVVAVICAAGSGLAPADKNLRPARRHGTSSIRYRIVDHEPEIAEGRVHWCGLKVGSGLHDERRRRAPAGRTMSVSSVLGVSTGPVTDMTTPPDVPRATRSKSPSRSRCRRRRAARRSRSDRDAGPLAAGRAVRTTSPRPPALLRGGHGLCRR